MRQSNITIINNNIIKYNSPLTLLPLSSLQYYYLSDRRRSASRSKESKYVTTYLNN